MEGHKQFGIVQDGPETDWEDFVRISEQRAENLEIFWTCSPNFSMCGTDVWAESTTESTLPNTASEWSQGLCDIRFWPLWHGTESPHLQKNQIWQNNAHEFWGVGPVRMGIFNDTVTKIYVSIFSFNDYRKPDAVSVNDAFPIPRM